MEWKTESEFEETAKKVMKIASPAQKKIFKDFQSGDEKLFMNLLKDPITQKSIDNQLQVMVNSVEGDTSQLTKEHTSYAKKKGWLKGFE